MVVDTSAIVAVLFQEDNAETFERALADAGRCLVSAVTRVEIACVVEGRKGEQGKAALEAFFDALDVEVATVDIAQVNIAIGAFRSYGKGRHPAGLNIGDCFSYALAKALDEPLLFKGNDFGLTDIRPVLA